MEVLGTIELLGIRANGWHGVLFEERVRSQPFEVDLRLEADLATAAATDNLEDTVDSALVVVAVARIVELESYRLLERLAGRIAGVCISLTAVTSVEVTIRKVRPIVPVHMASMAVTIRRDAPAGNSNVGPPLRLASGMTSPRFDARSGTTISGGPLELGTAREAPTGPVA
jgi:dihydroneopterin aldolase